MMLRIAKLSFLALTGGCAATSSPLPPGIDITTPPVIPNLAVASPPKQLPEPAAKPVADTSAGPLELDEVLASLDATFPLLNAIEQERIIAAGLQHSAEGSFDSNVRLRGVNRDGTFDNNTLDASVEQPVPWHGVNFFAGYRFGFGSFPVYYGNLKTAQGGELRAGFTMPLLRDGPIDRRRAVLRQAQIQTALADPAVQQVRLDAIRAARRAYYNWLAAGEVFQIAGRFVEAAKERENVIQERFRRGAASELDAAQAKQTLAEREGRFAAAAQRWQQATIDLSLLYRDSTGTPLLAGTGRLPRKISAITPTAVTGEEFATDLNEAPARRPEVLQFQLQKERTGLDIKLAENQMQPGLALGAAAAQDVGLSGVKPPNTGIFALDRTAAEAFLVFDVPVQRREARGRLMAAQARMNQLLEQERYTRDRITAEIQSAFAALERDRERLAKARIEQDSARRVVQIAQEQYDRGAIRLFELNSLEVIALDAEAKVADILADFFRVLADYRAASGRIDP